MINFNKKDPVADAIRDIMEKELSTAQKKIAALAGDKKTIDALDLAALRAGKKPTSEETVEENAFDYKSPRQPEPNGGSGVKKGTRYGGSKQKEKPEQEESKEKMKEEIDPSDRTEDTLAGRVKTKQKDDVGPGSDGRSTKVKYRPGPMTLKGMKEKYEEPIIDELINEVLSKDADAGDYIHDFIHSDNPKFAGKSKAERKKMALGAYYGKKNEEVNEGLKSVAKKAFKALTGGSDEDQRKDLQRKMGVPQTGQKPKTEEVEQMDEIVKVFHHTADGASLSRSAKDPNDAGAVAHRKAAADAAKAARAGGNFKFKGNSSMTPLTPKSSGGNVQAVKSEEVKPPVHYGGKGTEGAKFDLYMQKRKQDNAKAAPKTQKEEVVMEGRPPTSQIDTPFVTDGENKPLNNAKDLAAKTMKRMKNEMLGKTGTSE